MKFILPLMISILMFQHQVKAQSQLSEDELSIIRKASRKDERKINLRSKKSFKDRRGQQTFFRGYLKKGSILISLLDETQFEVGVGTFVQCEIDPKLENDFYFILSKNGERKYKVRPSQIVDIEKDLDMQKKILASEEYAEPDQTITYNHSFSFELIPQYRYLYSGAEELGGYFSETKPTSLTGNQFELNGFYKSHLFVEPGLGFSYIQTTSDKNSEIKGNALLANILFKFPLWEDQQFIHQITLGSDLSLGQYFSNATDRFKFRSNSLRAIFETVYQSSWGPFAFSLEFKRDYLTLASEASTNFSENIHLDYWNAGIGYVWSFE